VGALSEESITLSNQKIDKRSDHQRPGQEKETNEDVLRFPYKLPIHDVHIDGVVGGHYESKQYGKLESYPKKIGDIKKYDSDQCDQRASTRQLFVIILEYCQITA
jgi:hypothetical protein